LFVFVNLAIFFFFGTKLNITENHLINFLFAFSVLPFTILMVLFGGYLGIFIQAPFLNLVLVIENFNKSFYQTGVILTFLPPIMIWLGILFQAKKT